MSAPIRIRDAVANEINLVVDSWLKSYLNGRRIGDTDRTRRVWQGHRQLVLRMLQRSIPRVALSEVTDEVAGWCCAEEGVLHFVYVKHWARQQKIAKRLIADATPGIFCYSHFTQAVRPLLKPEWFQDDYAFYLEPKERHAAQEVFVRQTQQPIETQSE